MSTKWIFDPKTAMPLQDELEFDFTEVPRPKIKELLNTSRRLWQHSRAAVQCGMKTPERTFGNLLSPHSFNYRR